LPLRSPRDVDVSCRHGQCNFLAQQHLSPVRSRVDSTTDQLCPLPPVETLLRRDFAAANTTFSSSPSSSSSFNHCPTAVCSAANDLSLTASRLSATVVDRPALRQIQSPIRRAKPSPSRVFADRSSRTVQSQTSQVTTADDVLECARTLTSLAQSNPRVGGLLSELLDLMDSDSDID
jgi:hypothetical protein